MKIKNKDFIEIEFTGQVKDGEIFDSNIKEDLDKVNLNAETKPFIFSVGEKMFLEEIDKDIIKREIGEKYEIELEPEKAFGKRNPSLIKIVPSKIFKEKQVIPEKGMTFNFDGRIAKIISISGGRVMTDFNNPLAGKTVIYKIKIKRKVEDLGEKIKSLMNFLFKREFKFKIKEKKLIIETEKQFGEFINLFKDKFKEIFDLEVETKEVNED